MRTGADVAAQEDVAAGAAIRAEHLEQLRSTVNLMRADCGLGAASWTDSPVTPGTPIKAVHLMELRRALTEAYNACSLTAPSYTDSVLTPSVTPVKALHFTELREAAEVTQPPPVETAGCVLGYEGITWLGAKHEQYSICYTAEYEQDVAFVEDWIDHAAGWMGDKYGVTELRNPRADTPLHVNVVLIPAPNADADTGTTRFMCCYDASGAFSSDGGFARIPYLTPSHPEWATRPAWGGMSLPPDDFHAKNLMHEFTHAAQFTVGAITWPPRVPWWISEGLAEYEGMFHTTENNRTEGYDNLVRYVHDAIPHGCGSSS